MNVNMETNACVVVCYAHPGQADRRGYLVLRTEDSPEVVVESCAQGFLERRATSTTAPARRSRMLADYRTRFTAVADVASLVAGGLRLFWPDLLDEFIQRGYARTIDFPKV